MAARAAARHRSILVGIAAATIDVPRGTRHTFANAGADGWNQSL